MMQHIPLLSMLLLLCATTAACSHVLGQFKSPGPQFRPKFRYWLPDASADADWVVKDIDAIADVGAGGLEWLPYYQLHGEQISDWTEFGYGSEAFLKLNRAAFQAAADRDLIFDFSVGANQGQGVPSETESPGLAVHLAYANVSVAPGGSFDGVLPLSKQPHVDSLAYFMHECEEFGRQNLSFVHAVEVVSELGGTVTLGQVLDVTSQVDTETRSLTWSRPSDSNSTWRIMAWYERYTNQRSIGGGENASNYIQNGSWIVDHFSTAGSRKMTDFYDNFIIPEDSDKELLAKIGGFAWEDSMEAMSALWWTPGFADRFREGRGYDITICIPFLVVKTSYWAANNLPYGETFVASLMDKTFADKCIDDYRLTLQQGYRDYLLSNVAWAHSRGVNYSCQPAYNLPLSMPDSIPLVDGPELESLGFVNADNYRQGAGPIHLMGNPILSSEAGAVSGSVYTQTMQDLLQIVRTGLAGGISMNVFHGFSYSGPYFNTSWPGFAIFSYLFTEMWTPRQPAWRHMNDTIGYVTRNQFALQIGTPQVDIAMIRYQPHFEASQPYNFTELERLGYTYEYLSAGNLELDEATAADRLLAPDGPAYQAVIFVNQTKISRDAAKKVEDIAAAGVPIIFVESSNFTSIGQRDGEDVDVNRIMSNVVSNGLPNVISISSVSDVQGALVQAQVTPRTSFGQDIAPEELWYTFRRKVDSTELVWIMNDGSLRKTVNVTFAVTGSKLPFVLDAWTGDITPALEYVADASVITIPVTLSAGETVIYAFVTDETRLAAPDVFPRHPTNIVTSSEGVKGFLHATSWGETGLVAKIPKGDATIRLASGETVQHTADIPEATTLDSWNVTVQRWHAADDYDTSGETAMEPHEYYGIAPAAWKDIDPDTLARVSGTGEYLATFSTPNTTANATLGALLHLGQLADSARVWLNGKLQHPVDAIRGAVVVDLTGSLAKPGAINTIRVETASTLYNALRADPDGFYTAGVTASMANAAYFEANGPKPYGILGPVRIEWVELLVIN